MLEGVGEDHQLRNCSTSWEGSKLRELKVGGWGKTLLHFTLHCLKQYIVKDSFLEFLNLINFMFSICSCNHLQSQMYNSCCFVVKSVCVIHIVHLYVSAKRLCAKGTEPEVNLERLAYLGCLLFVIFFVFLWFHPILASVWWWWCGQN